MMNDELNKNSALSTQHSAFPEGKHSLFATSEARTSQIPAVQLLVAMGYKYIPPEKALAERQGRLSNVLLENVLRNQLKEINRIRYKGGEYLFSEENIQSAVQKLKNIKYDGLLKTNEAVYDLITLGTAMEQTIEGDSKSFNLNYVDWRNPGRNRFHVTVEFSVERARSTETARPDIVLFVNGIPIVVIECKAPNEEVDQAISQQIRNQRNEYIPRLFTYAQVLIGVNKNDGQIATVGSGKRFWSKWRELEDDDADVHKMVNRSLTNNEKDKLFTGEFKPARSYFNALEKKGNRLVTEQDRLLYSICRPARLLELIYKFTLFDSGIKKIARYQQYFVVKSIHRRVERVGTNGRRRGGIVWHTQGSGKSLTMVMLARNLALSDRIKNPRIILVTDRENLDRQLGNTFAACGLHPERATSGRHLSELVSNDSAGIITTLIHKFDRALSAGKIQNSSPDIFVLVDESHRTQYGSMAARMRQVFPNACYIGFTGTPLMKKEKSSFRKFGGLINPIYPIRQAVEDETVVPLLYEGRMVDVEQDQNAIDKWFGRVTEPLSESQKADLKSKYSRSEILNQTDPVVYMRAFDISEHFVNNWQGTGFKAQLVAPRKAVALKYHECLKELGVVSSAVVISGPDTREGNEEVDEEPKDEVVRFWEKMMRRYGSEEEYNKQLISQFKDSDDPEILIVVSKLLTGFDAPRNTVLYLCSTLREHTLLQAIARVNRVYEDKDFGFILDYAGVLGELDKALDMYKALEGFDEEDLEGTLHSVDTEIRKLPQTYSDLWDLFRSVRNSLDEEAFEVFLGDDDVREDFYQRLSEYAKCLSLCMSSERFFEEVNSNDIKRYKNDLLRFQKLKISVKQRYAETVDFRDYHPKIKKLLDRHLKANDVQQLNEPVNIFDNADFKHVKESMGIYETKSVSHRADVIASTMKRTITERLDEDRVFYEKFSKLIQEAIDEYRNKRISDQQYLDKISELRNKFVTREREDVPDSIKGNDRAAIVYGNILPIFQEVDMDAGKREFVVAGTALAIQEIVERHWKVQFWDDEDVQKQTENEIDDYLYDKLKGQQGIELSVEQMDRIIASVMQHAKYWNK